MTPPKGARKTAASPLTGRRADRACPGDLEALQAQRDAIAKERDDLKTNLDACRTRSERERETIEGLRADKIDLQTKLDSAHNTKTAAAVAAPVAAPKVEEAPVAAGQGTKPEGLSGPRGGVADDLKEISGVGPKLEKLLHKLGYYHLTTGSLRPKSWPTAKRA